MKSHYTFPFFDNPIKKVVILYGVTSIGDSIFENCISLTEATIPSSVKSIGAWAFYNCINLKRISIPSSIQNIGHHAFDSCRLTGVTIPNSVNSIGDYSFYRCIDLKSVTVLNKDILIGEYSLGYYNSQAGVKQISNFVIKGKKGSSAQRYAEKHGFRFITI
jgi:hypothetical protein